MPQQETLSFSPPHFICLLALNFFHSGSYQSQMASCLQGKKKLSEEVVVQNEENSKLQWFLVTY